MVIAEITVTPLGTGSPSLSRYVAECARALDESGVRHTLTPMGSVIEGTLEEILEVVRMVHLIPFSQGVQRVSTRVVIDERRDKDVTGQDKVESVQRKLAGPSQERD
jgi:uncharacterized protein (TIGR00106 family)